MNINKACVLRSGGDFKPEHVQWLARQVPGLVCLSDVPVPGVKTIPLAYDWPKWWAKLEMFGPSLSGDVLMIDLDTVVRKLPAMPDRSTVLRDFGDPSVIGSGLMFVTEADRARIWAAWIESPEKHMAANQQWPRLGDQGFLFDYLKDAQKWQDIAKVYSYKFHCRNGMPSDAEVICFHGNPRPWDVKANWIPSMKPSFGDLVMKHKGERICLMGGGPSLESDLEKIKADVYISINEHGAKLRKVDYIFAMDDTHTERKVHMHKHLRQFSDAPIIAPWAWADYQLHKWPHMPRVMLSGVVAEWAAYMMGAHPVILCGYDCYGGEARSINAHKLYAPEVKCEVRVASGPLIGIHPAYVARERRKPYNPPDVLAESGDSVRVRVMSPVDIHGTQWPIGSELHVSAFEFRRQIKHKSLVVIDEN